MVFGYHSVLTTYGFWLPNDPRGSGSDYVRPEDLYRRHGPATKTTSRRSVANRPHDRVERLAAKQSLRYPAVEFDGRQALAVAMGFQRYAERSGLIVWACAILPSHIHLVTARHRYFIERVVNLMKGDATRKLMEGGLHPFAHLRDENGKVPRCWGGPGWNVYLSTEEEIRGRIAYVEANPPREGKRKRRWSFVTPFRPEQLPQLRRVRREGRAGRLTG